MKIPYREYTFESFVNQFLAQELPPFTRPKIACFLTDFSTWEGRFTSLEKVLKGYGIKIEKLGKEERLTKEELKTLLKAGTPIFEEFADGELRTLI